MIHPAADIAIHVGLRHRIERKSSTKSRAREFIAKKRAPKGRARLIIRNYETFATSGYLFSTLRSPLVPLEASKLSGICGKVKDICLETQLRTRDSSVFLRVDEISAGVSKIIESSQRVKEKIYGAPRGPGFLRRFYGCTDLLPRDPST